MNTTRLSRLFCIVMIILAILFVVPAMAGQETNKTGKIFVSTSGNDGNDGSSGLPVKTLGRAIELSSDGDIISIAPGLYNTEGDRGIVIDKGITLAGAGPDMTIIDGMNKSQIFITKNFPPITFDNLTLTGGSGRWGGAVDIEYGNVRFSHTVIRNSFAESGGGVAIEVGKAEFADSAITGNSATDDGGGVTVEGSSSANITDSEVSGNSAKFGGGIYLGDGKSRVAVARSKILNNRASGSGGGMYVAVGNASVSCSVMSGNNGGTAGGAAALNYGNARITSSKIVNNTALYGGSGVMTYTTIGELVAVNDIFYNTENVEGHKRSNMEEIGGGTFSINKTLETSITGGSYAGGNAWGQPDGNGFSQKCSDADQDGICDSSYQVVNTLFDNYPLVLGSSALSQALDSSLPCREDIVPDSVTARHLSISDQVLGSTGIVVPIPVFIPLCAVIFSLFLIRQKRTR